MAHSVPLNYRPSDWSEGLNILGKNINRLASGGQLLNTEFCNNVMDYHMGSTKLNIVAFTPTSVEVLIYFV